MGRSTVPEGLFKARKFGGKRYHRYKTFTTKREAQVEANRLRRDKVWMVRIVKSSLGYELYTRQT